MNYFKRKLYNWHDHKRNALACTPGGPTPRGRKLIAYHERKMLELTEEANT